MNLAKLTKRLMEDPEFREEYERTEPDYMLVREMLRMRQKRKITQEALAEKVGTAQSRIARIEHANDNPSLDVIKRIAEALDCKLEIRFVPKRKQAAKQASTQDAKPVSRTRTSRSTLAAGGAAAHAKGRSR